MCWFLCGERPSIWHRVKICWPSHSTFLWLAVLTPDLLAHPQGNFVMPLISVLNEKGLRQISWSWKWVSNELCLHFNTTSDCHLISVISSGSGPPLPLSFLKLQVSPEYRLMLVSLLGPGSSIAQAVVYSVVCRNHPSRSSFNICLESPPHLPPRSGEVRPSCCVTLGICLCLHCFGIHLPHLSQ